MKGKVSKTGYKKDSPDKDNDFNIIPSNSITMHNVMHHVLGIDDEGNQQLMEPGKDYRFQGKKVLEIPIKNNSMKKTPQVENFQDLLNLMEEGGPIVLQYPIDRMLPMAQVGKSTKTPIRTIGTAAKATDEEQRVAKQFNFSNIPETTERGAWNKFLEHVQKTYPANTEETKKALNYGTAAEAQKKFTELSTGYNTGNVPTWKQEYATRVAGVKAGDPNYKNFDPTKVSEDQYIKDRQVTPEMMQNAQKFYGQQTSKDAWFGSETAQSYYPKIEVKGQAYPDVKPGQMDAVNKTAAGKYSPVEVTPYQIPGQARPTPYSQGVVPLKGYDPKGQPIFNFQGIREFTPADSSNMFYEKSIATPDYQTRMQRYLTPSVAPTTTIPLQQKLGGSPFTKGTLKSILGDVIKKQFGGSTSPQGLDTDSYIADKKATFANSLKKNMVGHMMEEEVMGMMDTGGGTYQTGGGTSDVLPMNVTTLPEVGVGNEDIINSNLNAPAQNVMSSMQTNFMDNTAAAAQTKRNNNSTIASGIKGGMDIFSNVLEQSRAAAYQKKSESEARMKALATPVAGSRGDVDVNDFSFRPNKVGMPTYQGGGATIADRQYKIGGSYHMTQEEMTQFMAMGGQIKFID